MARHVLDAAGRRARLAGVNYPLDRAMVAAELGFAQVSPNAMDAVAARDTAFAYLAIAANCALTLSRLAEELVLWTTQEFGLATLPESWTSGSSIMPQKRNPDGAELVRAKAAGFLARLQGLGALLKGLPLAYNNDLQEDKLYVFGTKEELDLCLAGDDGHGRRSRSSTQRRAREAAEGGYAAATDVADYLVGKGLPFREAHRVAGRLVAHAGGRRPAAGFAPDRPNCKELSPAVRRGLLRGGGSRPRGGSEGIAGRDGAGASGRAAGPGSHGAGASGVVAGPGRRAGRSLSCVADLPRDAPLVGC